MNNGKEPLLLLTLEEQARRLRPILASMVEDHIAVSIIGNNANIYYLTGRVFSGYILIKADGEIGYYVKRPNNLEGDHIIYVHKPELMAESISACEKGCLGLELDALSYSEAMRLKAIAPERHLKNCSPTLRQARSVKTPIEQSKIIESGRKHEKVYLQIPRMFHVGMTDLELQFQIEAALRREGCLGQFRISGDSMELFMGNIIAGDNADNPTPYDFAMGGAGSDPSLPVGANGTVLSEGMALMVDANGNFTGYMTDMTRTFRIGELSEVATNAHECSITICKDLASIGLPGTPAKALYERALEIASREGLNSYFMGHRQKAGFVGHGVGIEINEMPVIAPRSRDILAEGNVIALEPKFVIPRIGAVGIENTYIVRQNGMECVTHAPERLINLI